ncbi:MAG TPA: hypothetical protein VMF57_19070 [Solirubrobacteraceae bacterium]|nr:hypothetical protein [Solirubrobacteraceae bacterium]
MDREELRHHIDSVALGEEPTAQQLASLFLGECWPGGPEDRTERAALDWLRRWHPDAAAAASEAELPRCSCSTGRCVLCN